MNLVSFLQLIRYKNLLLICYTFCLLKFLLFPSFKITQTLNTFQFSILLIATIFITAAGYIINDIFDIEADKINKPKKRIVSKILKLERAKKTYFILNSIGIIFGIALSLNIQKPNLAFVFFAVPLLLYYYSKTFQKKAIIGNLLVSILVALSVFLPVLFETNNKQIVLLVFSLAIFSFLLNLSREIVKDIIDIKGDYKSNYKTLPIILGTKRTTIIAAVITIIPTLFLVFLIVSIQHNFNITRVYLLITCVLPLVYITSKLLKKTTKNNLHIISTTLKLVMFFGITSLLLISYNL